MSDTKLAVVGYVPPSKMIGATEFFDNIRRFKTKHPLVLYSDQPWDGVIKLKASPEIAKGSVYLNKTPNKWAVNNLVFLTGLKIARSQGITHMLYIEADCRVLGDEWDAKVFEEAFKTDLPLMAGTIGCYNACNLSMTFTRAWHAFMARTSAGQFPVPCFGGQGAAERQEPAVFTNGALAIYDVNWVTSKCSDGSTPDVAAKITAWDYHLGRELVREFGDTCFHKVKHLSTIYSGYGDVATTEEERRELLISGKVVAVHQIKSDWQPVTVAEVKPIEVRRSDPVVGTLIVSHAKDYTWLSMCLRAYRKFATGFKGVTVAVPRSDRTVVRKLCQDMGASMYLFDQAGDGKGHLHHNAIKCMADEIVLGADAVMHIDSDCIFTEPVTPLDYLVDGKPILLMEPYDHVSEGRKVWKPVTEAALGIDVEHEFMVRHLAVHLIRTYKETRQLVEQAHREKFLPYVLRQKKTYPCGFAEFNTLGAYAYYYMRSKYHWIDVSKEERPKDKLIQFWSHKSPSELQSVPFNGKVLDVKPAEWIEEILR